MELKYSEIIKKNTDLGKNFKSKPYKITVISNIIVYQIKEILEYQLRIREINTKRTSTGSSSRRVSVDSASCSRPHH